MSEVAGTKRSSEGNAQGDSKKARGDKLTLRFLLKARHAGGIIGKGGETIKRLRSEYSASVSVPDTTTEERVLTIGAEQDDCLKVLKDCLPLVHEAPYPVITGGQGRGEPKEQSPFEVNFLVHSSQVGGIIGRGGARIKQLREETSASVKVYQDCLPDCNERVIAIAGSEDQILAALQQMLEIMQAEPIKGSVTLYDPSYVHSQSTGFNDNYNNYNNFNGPPPGRNGMGGGMRGGNQMGGGPGPRGGGMGGMGGGGGRGGNFGAGPQGNYGGGGLGQQSYNSNFGGDNFSNNYSNQGPPQGDRGFGDGAGGNFNSGAGGNYGGAGGNYGSAGGNYGGAGGNYGGAGGNFGGAGGGNQGTGGPPESTQVTVPNDMAGAIIGKGGERIRGIRQKSGADIKFSESEPGKTDRLITITGSQDQLQYAQYLMQQCVRENYKS